MNIYIYIYIYKVKVFHKRHFLEYSLRYCRMSINYYMTNSYGYFISSYYGITYFTIHIVGLEIQLFVLV